LSNILKSFYEVVWHSLQIHVSLLLLWCSKDGSGIADCTPMSPLAAALRF